MFVQSDVFEKIINFWVRFDVFFGLLLERYFSRALFGTYLTCFLVLNVVLY